MDSISLAISSTYSPTFSARDALVSYSGGYSEEEESQVGTLFTEGCNASGHLNCSAACVDVNQIFNNPYTFQNCIVLTALAPESWNAIHKATLSIEAVHVAAYFSNNTTDSGFRTLVSNVNQTINNCLAQYCASSTECTSSTSSYNYVPWYSEAIGQAYSENQTNIGFADICPYAVKSNLNSDIGGIGVRELTVSNDIRV